MLEFMFFDDDLRRQFIAFAQERGVSCAEKEDGMGMVVAISEDIQESIWDALEDFYEDLQEQQAERINQAEGEAARQAAGIRVMLDNGHPCMIRLEPHLANQLLAAFSLEDVQSLVQAIVRSVENPDDGPVCRRD